MGIFGPAERRRARAAQALLLALTALAVLDLFASAAGLYGDVGWSILLEVGAALGLLSAYLMARRGHITAGVVLAIAVVTAIILYFRASTSPGDAGGNALMFFLAVPILVAGLLLPARASAPVAALTILAAVVGEQYFREPHLSFAEGLAQGAGMVLLLLSVAVLSVAASAIHQRDALQLDANTAELKAAAKALEEAAAERRRMFSQVAHDLANPLSPIMLQLSVLERSASEGSSRGMAIIRRNVEHLMQQVEDLKDLARGESRRFVLTRVNVDLAVLAAEAVESHMPNANQRGVELRTLTRERAIVHGDRNRLSQVLYNLLGNALKFTPKGGHVIVETGVVHNSAICAVQDTGRGLTPHEAARLFQPFVQVHAPGEIPERGTGLGLYIANSIVEAHDGTLGVSSPGLGAGATFTMRLPLAPPVVPRP